MPKPYSLFCKTALLYNIHVKTGAEKDLLFKIRGSKKIQELMYFFETKIKKR